MSHSYNILLYMNFYCLYTNFLLIFIFYAPFDTYSNTRDFENIDYFSEEKMLRFY